jgi:hypothetical protein
VKTPRPESRQARGEGASVSGVTRQPDDPAAYVRVPPGLSRAEAEEIGRALFDQLESERLGREVEGPSGNVCGATSDGG